MIPHVWSFSRLIPLAGITLNRDLAETLTRLPACREECTESFLCGCIRLCVSRRVTRCCCWDLLDLWLSEESQSKHKTWLSSESCSSCKLLHHMFTYRWTHLTFACIRSVNCVCDPCLYRWINSTASYLQTATDAQFAGDLTSLHLT